MKVTEVAFEPEDPLSLLESPPPLPQPLTARANARVTAARLVTFFVCRFMLLLPLLVANADWRELRAFAPVVSPGSDSGEPRQDTGGHHRGDEQQPDDDVDDVDRHALQPQGAGDHADEQDSRDDAVELAAAAEDGAPAQQDRRDHLELETHGVVAARAGEPQREVDAREGGHHPGEQEERELRAPHRYAGELGGLGVQAD